VVYVKTCSGEEPSSLGHEEHGISEDSPQHDDTHRICEPPYMMPMGARLTQVQEKKVLEKVRAIASEVPIYVAVMTKASVLVSLVSLEKYSCDFELTVFSLERI
jgi:hypothetical protein